jgi:hypothetical protein
MIHISKNISIVIVCKDETKTIYNTLLSIASQADIADTNVFIINNNLTMQMLDIIEEFGQEFKNINIQIVNSTKNNVTELLKTPYCLFLSPDTNLADSHVLEICNKLLNRVKPKLITSLPKCYNCTLFDKTIFSLNNFIIKAISLWEPFALNDFFLVDITEFNKLGKFICCNQSDWRLSRKFKKQDFILVVLMTSKPGS